MIFEPEQIQEYENATGMSIIEIDLDKVKECTSCKKYKDFSKFYILNAKRGPRLRAICKKCSSRKHKIYYKENAETIKRQFSEYYRTKTEQHKKTCARYYQNNPEFARYYLHKKYAQKHGIPFEMTREEYKKLMKHSKCFATGQKLSSRKRRNMFVARVHMNKPYVLPNMEITNKQTFYDKLTDHHYNLREELYEQAI